MEFKFVVNLVIFKGWPANSVLYLIDPFLDCIFNEYTSVAESPTNKDCQRSGTMDCPSKLPHSD
eukprot:scaffold746_cov123-Cylindrotheca_fusiformis.AAC.16